MPTAAAAFTSSLDRCSVSITIAVLGERQVISRAASRPLMTGMSQSKITTSGCKALTFSIATRPFSASPHIFNSGFCSMYERIKLRMRALSSTIRILTDTHFPEHELSDGAYQSGSAAFTEDGHLYDS